MVNDNYFLVKRNKKNTRIDVLRRMFRRGETESFDRRTLRTFMVELEKKET